MVLMYTENQKEQSKISNKIIFAVEFQMPAQLLGSTKIQSFTECKPC